MVWKIYVTWYERKELPRTLCSVKAWNRLSSASEKSMGNVLENLNWRKLSSSVRRTSCSPWRRQQRGQMSISWSCKSLVKWWRVWRAIWALTYGQRWLFSGCLTFIKIETSRSLWQKQNLLSVLILAVLFCIQWHFPFCASFALREATRSQIYKFTNISCTWYEFTKLWPNWIFT